MRLRAAIAAVILSVSPALAIFAMVPAERVDEVPIDRLLTNLNANAQKLSEAERQALLRQSALQGRYEKAIDRESAYELLTARAQQGEAQQPQAVGAGSDLGSMAGELLGGFAGQVMKTAMRQAANQLGRQLVRGVLGSLLGGKRR